jgi:hypothetical protein
MLKAYDKWDTVMMPVHAADHAYLSFEQRAAGGGRAGTGIQAIKVFFRRPCALNLSSVCVTR